MPADTPIYGFTYPCPADPVDAGSFATLANQIDAKMLDLQAAQTDALNRPNRTVNAVNPQQTITAGVETILTHPNASFTIPVTGVWSIRAEGAVFSTAPTINMMRLRILRNAAVFAGFTQNAEGNSVGLPPTPYGTTLFIAGDLISLSFLYNGTGTMNVGSSISARLICRRSL